MPIQKLRTPTALQTRYLAGLPAGAEPGNPDGALEAPVEFTKVWTTGSCDFAVDTNHKKWALNKDGVWRKFRSRKPIVIGTAKLDVKKFIHAARLYKSAHEELEAAYTGKDMPDPKKLEWIDDRDDGDDPDTIAVPSPATMRRIVSWIPVEQENE